MCFYPNTFLCGPHVRLQMHSALGESNEYPHVSPDAFILRTTILNITSRDEQKMNCTMDTVLL